MRANEFINEIDYAAGTLSLQISDSDVIQQGTIIGDIDGRDVWEVQTPGQRLVFFHDGEKIDAFIILDNDKLNAIRNITGIPGAVTSLVGFVTHIEKTPIRIAANEPLTPEGFRWLYKLISRGGRGLTITANGKLVDLPMLKKEWENHMTTAGYGPTEIIIESKMTRVLVSKKENRLVIPTFFIGDEEIL